MLFNSWAYAIFLPIVFVLYWALPNRYRWIWLWITSCYFYMSWNPQYVVLILGTTLVSYSVGIGLEKNRNAIVRKMLLSFAFIVCLGVLFFFKYFNFFSGSVANLLVRCAIPVHPITVKVLLPVGISFYTFQTLSYVVDVYRGKVTAEHHFGIYATFISFFPQLVAGPIERTDNLLPQIKAEKVFDEQQATYGLKLIAWGLFKKLAIADVLAIYVDTAYSSLGNCTGLDALMVILFFTLQIYCDFSGYSDIAIGSAKLLGINLMKNFMSPYYATSIKEFWARWHISLSTWFRDYVYIPLGGSRCAKWKTDRNLLVTFMVSGLWHGANWTFVIWGSIHGLMQILEKHLKLEQDSQREYMNWIKRLLVFLFCNIAWVFFRAQNLGEAIVVLEKLISGWRGVDSWLLITMDVRTMDLILVVAAIFLLAIYDYASLKCDVMEWLNKQSVIVRWAVYLGLIWFTLFCIPRAGSSEFVYFQF